MFFGGDTLRIAELDEVARRYPRIDLALLPVNGLAIRPAFNRQVVMTAEQAAELCGLLRPAFAVPIRYRYTAGPVRDRQLLKYDGTAERFAAALTSAAPATQAGVFPPAVHAARDPLRVQPVRRLVQQRGPLERGPGRGAG